MDLLRNSCYSSSSDIEEDEEEEELEEQDDENETKAVSIVAAAASTAKVGPKKNGAPPPAATATSATETLSRRRKRGNVTVESTSTDQNGSAGISMGTKRIRQQGHVVGNWAGLCFLPVRIDDNDEDDDDDDDDEDALSFFRVVYRRRFAEQLGRTLEEMGYSGVCCVHNDDNGDNNNAEPLHVSLSRPFYLQQANLQPFVRALSAELQRTTTRGGDTIMDDDNVVPPRTTTTSTGRIPHRRGGPRGPFRITIDTRQVVILTNDDATRSFLAWNVHDTAGNGREELARLIACCDRILQCYHQPVFYNDTPQYHVSWASLVPAIPSDMIQRAMGTMMKQMICTGTAADDDNDDDNDDNGHCIDVTITHLCVKFGTVQLFEIPL
jgi:Uncharacterised conserved protein